MKKKLKMISTICGTLTLLGCFAFGLFSLLDHNKKQNVEVSAEEYAEVQVLRKEGYKELSYTQEVTDYFLYLQCNYDFNIYAKVGRTNHSISQYRYSFNLNFHDCEINDSTLFVFDIVPYNQILSTDRTLNFNSGWLNASSTFPDELYLVWTFCFNQVDTSELTLTFTFGDYPTSEYGEPCNFDAKCVITNDTISLAPSKVALVASIINDNLPIDFIDVREDFKNAWWDVAVALGYQDGWSEGWDSAYDNAYREGYTDGGTAGYNNGWYYGYEEGYNDAITQDGASIYQQGYYDGYSEGQNEDSTVTSIFSGILQVGLVPINFFLAIFNFEILGINLSGFIRALFTVAITIIILKLLFGGKGASE